MKFLLDCTDTSHSRQQSGIPQVVRNLFANFPADNPLQPVVYDRYSCRWRNADKRERAWLEPSHHVAVDAPSSLRNWSDWQKARGRILRGLPSRGFSFPTGSVLLVPELFFPAQDDRFGTVLKAPGCALAAIFHDAVALRFPEFSPPVIARNFAAYVDCLATFDAVAAISEASRQELLAYWESRGFREHPPVVVIPLGTDLCQSASAGEPPLVEKEPPLVLFVSTLEPRKNHRAVLEVAEALWSEGLRFRLAFAGGCNAEVRDEWQARLSAVKGPGGCFTYHGRVSREKLHNLYREAAFTVYPSFWEGFGLPVLESLSFGKPCLCSDRGGLAEVVAEGGCLVVDPDDPEALARGWRQLLSDKVLYRNLADAARARTFRSWTDYAGDIEAWLGGIRQRPTATDPRTRFLEASTSQKAATNFLEPFVGEYRSIVDELSSRWKVLQPSLELAGLEPPARTFPTSIREADLHELDSLESAGVISFDIFDTCLVRLIDRPEDIFELLGENLESLTGMKGADFARERVESENRLRAEGLEAGDREDTTLGEVYVDLSTKFGWDSETRTQVMHRELELERLFLQPDETVREKAWALYRGGARLAYCSEMYLPGETLRSLLGNAGFPVEGVPVFSSGETGLSKGTGNLYRRLQQSFPDESLLHIGDNPVSDVEVPARLGIDARRVRTKKIIYPDRFSNVLHAVTGESVRVASAFWEDFGYRVAGPVHFAFASWIYSQCLKGGYQRAFFLSRDGWFPLRVFDRLQEEWGAVAKSHYLYGSRELLGLGSMADIGPAEWDFLLKPSPLLCLKDVFERLGIPATEYAGACERHGLGDPARRISHHWGFIDPRDHDRLYHAISSCMESFLAHRARIAQPLREYLGEAGLFAGKSLLVDLGWGGSSIESIRKLVPQGAETPHGLYFGLFQENLPGTSSFFTDGPGRTERIRLIKGSVALLEFLFGSPEPTARAMVREAGEWRPVFRKPLPRYDVAAYEAMGRGISAYTEGVLEILRHPQESEAQGFVEDILRRLIFDPGREELKNLAAVSHGEGWGTDHRLTLLPRLGENPSPGLVHEAYCYAPWKPGLRRLLEQLEDQSGPAGDLLSATPSD
jgi:glycosyltransferase involved in cell wall biosynthesis